MEFPWNIPNNEHDVRVSLYRIGKDNFFSSLQLQMFRNFFFLFLKATIIPASAKSMFVSSTNATTEPTTTTTTVSTQEIPAATTEKTTSSVTTEETTVTKTVTLTATTTESVTTTATVTTTAATTVRELTTLSMSSSSADEQTTQALSVTTQSPLGNEPKAAIHTKKKKSKHTKKIMFCGHSGERPQLIYGRIGFRSLFAQNFTFISYPLPRSPLIFGQFTFKPQMTIKS